jgi:hypothetical protein
VLPPPEQIETGGSRFADVLAFDDLEEPTDDLAFRVKRNIGEVGHGHQVGLAIEVGIDLNPFGLERGVRNGSERQKQNGQCTSKFRFHGTSREVPVHVKILDSKILRCTAMTLISF